MDKGISPEVVRSVLLERSNFPCLATKSAVEVSPDTILPATCESK